MGGEYWADRVVNQSGNPAPWSCQLNGSGILRHRMSQATHDLEARSIEAELDRLRATRGRGLTVETWDDGRAKIACSTGMRIAAWTDILELLRGLPTDAAWDRIWSELFDFPEAPE